MNEKPIVSFITVNYNGLKDTCELIESLQRTIQSVPYEIIVVDNASRENEAEIIRQKYQEPTNQPQQTGQAEHPCCLAIQTIRSEKNVGFSSGNNLGIKKAQGQYFFLINNDAYIEEDGLQALIDRLESHHNILGVSPKIRFATPPRLIQYAGYTPLSTLTLRNQSIGCGKEDNGDFDTPHPTPYLHGAAMMVKSRVLYAIGDMPDIFFLYYEELDWSTFMTTYGYELWYEPRCTVFHKESQSTGQQSPLRTFYLTRNRLLYAYRNRTGLAWCLSIAYQMTIAASKNSLLFLLKRRPDLAAAVWKGVGHFIILPRKKY